VRARQSRCVDLLAAVRDDDRIDVVGVIGPSRSSSRVRARGSVSFEAAM
jgi:hypothetical protein